MKARGIELAPRLEIRDGRQLYSCRACGRPMQQDRRKVAGWAPLPGVARHESGGRCQNCCSRPRQRSARAELVAARWPDGSEPSEIPERRGRPRTDAYELWATLWSADMTWADDAACKYAEDPNAFSMPDNYRGRRPTEGAIEAARNYCTQCPVVAECKAFAASHSTREAPVTGLWGGEWRTRAGAEPLIEREQASA